jgi:hypothetical protein
VYVHLRKMKEIMRGERNVNSFFFFYMFIRVDKLNVSIDS